MYFLAENNSISSVRIIIKAHILSNMKNVCILIEQLVYALHGEVKISLLRKNKLVNYYATREGIKCILTKTACTCDLKNNYIYYILSCNDCVAILNLNDCHYF